MAPINTIIKTILEDDGDDALPINVPPPAPPNIAASTGSMAVTTEPMDMAASSATSLIGNLVAPPSGFVTLATLKLPPPKSVPSMVAPLTGKLLHVAGYPDGPVLILKL